MQRIKIHHCYTGLRSCHVLLMLKNDFWAYFHRLKEVHTIILLLRHHDIYIQVSIVYGEGELKGCMGGRKVTKRGEKGRWEGWNSEG